MKPRQRTCKIKAEGCQGKFKPFSTLQACCMNPKCVLENKDRQAEKRHRREKEKFREANKPRKQWEQEAQTAFNRWVRLRDAGKPCISCGNSPNDKDLLTGSRWDAGHYRSVGACPALRFHPLNCHAQCVRCNRDLSGNTVEYRLRLIKRIGEESLAWIEGPHDPNKYTIDELKEIKSMYAGLAREIERKAA
ncbi:MAG: ninG protein [Spongiibacteraceae bacterium]|nr:ninG protein [Spongiibacteraceae bacterium]|tara:strand:+ start:6620 stop:7195 length:576 start_codon:yes stop_codon:yes gene_type:complete